MRSFLTFIRGVRDLLALLVDEKTAQNENLSAANGHYQKLIMLTDTNVDLTGELSDLTGEHYARAVSENLILLCADLSTFVQDVLADAKFSDDISQVLLPQVASLLTTGLFLVQGFSGALEKTMSAEEVRATKVLNSNLKALEAVGSAHGMDAETTRMMLFTTAVSDDAAREVWSDVSVVDIEAPTGEAGVVGGDGEGVALSGVKEKSSFPTAAEISGWAVAPEHLEVLYFVIGAFIFAYRTSLVPMKRAHEVTADFLALGAFCHGQVLAVRGCIPPEKLLVVGGAGQKMDLAAMVAEENEKKKEKKSTSGITDLSGILGVGDDDLTAALSKMATPSAGTNLAPGVPVSEAATAEPAKDSILLNNGMYEDSHVLALCYRAELLLTIFLDVQGVESEGKKDRFTEKSSLVAGKGGVVGSKVPGGPAIHTFDSVAKLMHATPMQMAEMSLECWELYNKLVDGALAEVGWTKDRSDAAISLLPKFSA